VDECKPLLGGAGDGKRGGGRDDRDRERDNQHQDARSGGVPDRAVGLGPKPETSILGGLFS